MNIHNRPGTSCGVSTMYEGHSVVGHITEHHSGLAAKMYSVCVCVCVCVCVQVSVCVGGGGECGLFPLVYTCKSWLLCVSNGGFLRAGGV